MSRAEQTAALPHPAEDLSADDDLLSWILVDQLGCMPNTKLGVHPQQVKFVGPVFKTDETLQIVKETVIKGRIQEGVQRLQEFDLIKKHLEAKATHSQRDRCIQHLRRYLLPLQPTSRVEIHTTARYSAITKHTELAVFATRPLAGGVVLTELQGSVVPLPDAWREEMEIGEGFAVEAKGEESDSEDGDGDLDTEEGDGEEMVEGGGGRGRRERTGKGGGAGGGGRGELRGARRSDRTKRRDFSIVWSGLKRCFQLFLGPARFLNHDCSPNVELLRQGKYVTFRVIRPVKIGEELTTFYGDNYFGRANIECLCLTCEQNRRGGFTPQPSVPRSRSRSSLSRELSSDPSSGDPKREGGSKPGPSGLRNLLISSSASPSSAILTDHIGEDVDSPRTPTFSIAESRTVSGGDEEEEEELEDGEEGRTTLRRSKSTRQAALSVKPWAYLRRQPRLSNGNGNGKAGSSSRTPEAGAALEQVNPLHLGGENDGEELPEDFPRCATCCRGLTERVWYNNRYFDHCLRCIRHALIFELPWPAHRPADYPQFPPAHLIPANYLPPRVSSVPLPTLSKAPRKRPDSSALADLAHLELPDTLEQRRARRYRTLIEIEEYIVEQMREEAWAEQVERDEREEERLREREEQKRQREEEKRKREEGKVRGSGVWSRYEYVDVEELERRRQEKERVVGEGRTRRGRAWKKEDESTPAEAAVKEGREPVKEASVDRKGKGKAVEAEEGKDEAVNRIENGSAESPSPTGFAQASSSASSAVQLETPPRRPRTSIPSAAKSEPATDSATKRGRGRPRGSGKHQRKAAKMLAQSQSVSRSVSASVKAPSEEASSVVDDGELPSARIGAGRGGGEGGGGGEGANGASIPSVDEASPRGSAGSGPGGAKEEKEGDEEVESEIRVVLDDNEVVYPARDTGEMEMGMGMDADRAGKVWARKRTRDEMEEEDEEDELRDQPKKKRMLYDTMLPLGFAADSEPHHYAKVATALPS